MMSYKYKPRTKAPTRRNKNYIHVTKGGKNKCILIEGDSVLPNCVGYAWGRFMEVLGTQPKLSLANAENWFSYRADGYKRGSKPRLGAVICWRKGRVGDPSDGAGHVAIVEQINKDGSILISESGYKKFRFRTSVIPSTYELAGYVFQGFIYNPKVPAPKKTIKSPQAIAWEVIQGKWGNGSERKEKLEKAGYNYQEVQSIVNELMKSGR